MAQRLKASALRDENTELLRKLLIVQLGLAGVPQQDIRAIVGGDILRVNEVMKHMKPKKRLQG